MSVRHTPRQSDRDIRLHDPHALPHSHSVPPHGIPHPALMNGNGHPATPLANNSAPTAAPVAPIVASPAVSNGVVQSSSIQKLAQANEQTWLLIGRVAEQMGNLEQALSAYENALRHNPMSLPGLTQVAGIARIKENYPKAIEYFERVINMQQENGEVWSALGHCFLMQDDLQKAYTAYQQALYLLPNPKEDPKLWYGIGILYDRYGSLDHAEEAFSSVLRMDKDFDKANEILFRLGIIYKQQGKYAESLDCFDRILRNPPSPLAHADIWFQIGHVYEQQRDHVRARDAYERVVRENDKHAKVLQQLGWLYHQDGSSFQNQDLAIQYLTKSLEADPSDAQSWYLLGRAYMAGQKYNKAYEAYQQAVYRDGRNPTFWCSIGVLYFQINQYRDALDAYSRAIRINPYISEVWFDLGSLYESCNNQISDAIDAYARAAELDPTNAAITQRLQLLRTAQATGGQLPAAPGPQDVHPTAYANQMVPPPPGLGGPPLLLHAGTSRPIFRTDSRGPGNELPLPQPPPPLPGRSSPGPFRNGPPPVILDESRHVPSHTQLAPMDVDQPHHHRAYSREGSRNGQSLLLHHPVPQQQLPGDGLRGPGHAQGHPHDPAFSRSMRGSSSSSSPPPHSARPRSVVNHIPQGYDARSTGGPGPAPIQRSPSLYTREPQLMDREREAWERERRLNEQREWERERERRSRPSGDYPPPQQPPQQFYSSRPHSPPYHGRPHSPRLPPRDGPMEASPRGHPAYARDPRGYMSGPGGPMPAPPRSPPTRRTSVTEMEPPSRRYDPRFDGREPQGREYEREAPVDARYANSPEALRMRGGPLPPPSYVGSNRTSESPHLQNQGLPVDASSRRRRAPPMKEKEPEPPLPAPTPVAEPAKKERKKRTRRVKEEVPPRGESYAGGPQSGAFKVDYRQKANSNGSPEPVSSNGSGSASRSVQPSPTNSVHLPPARALDEDYDEGVAETLMDLASSRGPTDPRGYPGAPPLSGYARSPPNNGGRITATSPHSMAKHPAMMARGSPTTSSKRPLSPGPEDHPELKRSRVGSMSGRRVSPPEPAATSSTRPSPIPFRQQPTSHSPETRQAVDSSYPPSPSLPTTLPVHPRPVGLSGSHVGPGVPLPPIKNMRTPPEDERDRMHSRSESPPQPPMPRGQGKREIVLHPAGAGVGAGSPPLNSGGALQKGTPSPSSSHGSHGKIALT
ncbi:hypothetical protein ABKN59_003203 [Abortiporus biennis]